MTSFQYIDIEARRALWNARDRSNDASIIASGFRIPVHTAVVGAASRHIDAHFRRSYRALKRCEYYIPFGDVNTVWKLLELVYLGSYATESCPLSEPSGPLNELALHGSLYMMAKTWELPDALQGVIYHRYRGSLERTQDPDAFLESVYSIFVPPNGRGLLGQIWHPFHIEHATNPDSLRGDRIVDLVMGQFHKWREMFHGPALKKLCQLLQSSSTFLVLFMEEWATDRSPQKKETFHDDTKC